MASKTNPNTLLKVAIGALVIIVLIIAFFTYTLNNSLVNTQASLKTANQTISSDNTQINTLNGQVSSQATEISNDNTQINSLQAEVNASTPHLETYTTYTPSGTVFSIPPGSYKAEAYGLGTVFNSNLSITGSFTSQGSYVYAALMTPSEYGSFTQNPSLLSTYGSQVYPYDDAYYGYTEGTTINSYFTSGIPESSLYVVFYNPSSSSTAVVTIVNQLTLQYTYTS